MRSYLRLFVSKVFPSKTWSLNDINKILASSIFNCLGNVEPHLCGYTSEKTNPIRFAADYDIFEIYLLFVLSIVWKVKYRCVNQLKDNLKSFNKMYSSFIKSQFFCVWMCEKSNIGAWIKPTWPNIRLHIFSLEIHTGPFAHSVLEWK